MRRCHESRALRTALPSPNLTTVALFDWDSRMIGRTASHYRIIDNVGEGGTGDSVRPSIPSVTAKGQADTEIAA